MEAASGFEPESGGFADLCLTTWLCRQKKWSGKRDLNPRLRPWQGRTLPLSYSRSAVWGLTYPISATLVKGKVLKLGLKEFPEPKKIVQPGPDGKSQSSPQEKHTYGMQVDAEIWIMKQQWNGCGYLKAGFVFPQVGGRHVVLITGNEVSQPRYRDLTPHDDAYHPRRHPAVGRQHDKRACHEELIRHRIHDFSKIGFKPHTTGVKPVEIVRNGRSAEHQRRNEGKKPIWINQGKNDTRYSGDTKQGEGIGITECKFHYS
jgi:hypothetical protein